jgi:hypothetical protein
MIISPLHSVTSALHDDDKDKIFRGPDGPEFLLEHVGRETQICRGCSTILAFWMIVVGLEAGLDVAEILENITCSFERHERV